MVNDRGTIKWTSLMLPEHVELLKEMWREDHVITKPVLDTQELGVLNEQLLQALEQQLTVSLSVYKNGAITEQTGIISQLDSSGNNVILQADGDRKITVSFWDILSITF